jgi:hypothetical protein
VAGLRERTTSECGSLDVDLRLTVPRLGSAGSGPAGQDLRDRTKAIDRGSLGAGSWDVEGGERTRRGDLGLPQTTIILLYFFRSASAITRGACRLQRGAWASACRDRGGRAAGGRGRSFFIFSTGPQSHSSQVYQSLQNDTPEASFETLGVVCAGGTATKLTV